MRVAKILATLLLLLLAGCGQMPVTSQPPATVTPSPTHALAAGDTRTRSSDGMILIYIPAGEFVMGTVDDDPDAGLGEKPQHTVYLDAFWIDQTEVTNAQYTRCVAAGACQSPTTCDFGELAYGDPSRVDHPVVCVDCSRGNFDDETAVDSYVVPGGKGCDGYPQTAPVGSFRAGTTAYGLLDMAGNAWEWMNDWRDWGYYDRSPYKNPAGPATGEMRIVRGGSFHYGLTYMRAATRHSAPPDHRADTLGFRCVALE